MEQQRGRDKSLEHDRKSKLKATANFEFKSSLRKWQRTKSSRCCHRSNLEAMKKVHILRVIVSIHITLS